MPVIPALRRLRQEDLESEASLGSIVRPCVKKQNKTKDSVRQGSLLDANSGVIFLFVFLAARRFELRGSYLLHQPFFVMGIF
jgi:hypothetical protein